MTEVCKNCKYRELCEELNYPLDCEDQENCKHYDAFYDGECQALEADYE